MPSTQQHHQTLTNLLTHRKFDEAEALWLDLAEKLGEQTDFLLLGVKEFADAGQARLAADLAALLTPGLKSSGKNHEWLYALKIQANANPTDKPLRAECLAAYKAIYAKDPRLPAILSVAQIDVGATQLPTGIARADTLLALNAGSYCQHKSWGVGKVQQFDIALSRVVVAFSHNPDHAMQLPYAAESLVPISPEHIEVRKQTDLPQLKQLAATDPVALVRLVLLSNGRAASADRIESVLTGSVLAASEWKKWWDSAKKALKRDPHFEIPARKTEPVVLRSAPVSQQDELLDAFRVAPSLTQKTDVARQFLKIIDETADPELLIQEFQDGLLDSLKKLKASYISERLEAAYVIDDLRSHLKAPGESINPLVDEILTGVRDMAGLLDELTAAAQKRLLNSHADRLLQDINRLPAKALDELADRIAEQSGRLSNLVRNQTASPDLLVWIWRNINQEWLRSFQSAALLQAMLSAVEAGSAKATKRLRDLLFSDDELVPSLLANADTDTVKDVSRAILSTPAFEELDRRSLMARVVRDFPFVQEFLITKSTKEQPLIVSKSSYDKRRAELDEIISKRIPENSKEIGVARSYGDLRENFEYKAAKDLQKVLMRRRAELEILLSRAQITDFSDVNPEAVAIGTTVDVTDLNTGKPTTYHVLGAWDSDPVRGIISYPAALAQAMFGKKTGETIEAAGDTGVQRLRIDRIAKTAPEILQTL